MNYALWPLQVVQNLQTQYKPQVVNKYGTANVDNCACDCSDMHTGVMWKHGNSWCRQWIAQVNNKRYTRYSSITATFHATLDWPKVAPLIFFLPSKHELGTDKNFS